MKWENHWAIWDPFSAGPIADSAPGRRERWRNAYFPGRSTTLGPEEHAVHNTSQPFLDHSVYFQNTIQVVEPTARHLLGPDFPEAPVAVAQIENLLSVIDKKSLGINMLAAVVIAAILPGLPGVYAAFATARELGRRCDRLHDRRVPGRAGCRGGGARRHRLGLVRDRPERPEPVELARRLGLHPRRADLAEPAPLDGHPAVARVGPMPIEPRHWLVLSSIPRAVYVVGAFVCVWFAIYAWTRPAGSFFVSAVLLLIVAIFVFVEPLYAPVPVVVPARTKDAERARRRWPDPAPMKLRDAVATEEFRKDLAARRTLLRPEGWRAEIWAGGSTTGPSRPRRCHPSRASAQRRPEHAHGVTAGDELDHGLGEPERHECRELHQHERPQPPDRERQHQLRRCESAPHECGDGDHGERHEPQRVPERGDGCPGHHDAAEHCLPDEHDCRRHRRIAARRLRRPTPTSPPALEQWHALLAKRRAEHPVVDPR